MTVGADVGAVEPASLDTPLHIVAAMGDLPVLNAMVTGFNRNAALILSAAAAAARSGSGGGAGPLSSSPPGNSRAAGAGSGPASRGPPVPGIRTVNKQGLTPFEVALSRLWVQAQSQQQAALAQEAAAAAKASKKSKGGAETNSRPAVDPAVLEDPMAEPASPAPNQAGEPQYAAVIRVLLTQVGTDMATRSLNPGCDLPFVPHPTSMLAATCCACPSSSLSRQPSS